MGTPEFGALSSSPSIRTPLLLDKQDIYSPHVLWCVENTTGGSICQWTPLDQWSVSKVLFTSALIFHTNRKGLKFPSLFSAPSRKESCLFYCLMAILVTDNLGLLCCELLKLPPDLEMLATVVEFGADTCSSSFSALNASFENLVGLFLLLCRGRDNQ